MGVNTYLIFDRTGKIISGTAAAASLINVSEDELRGMGLDDLIRERNELFGRSSLREQFFALAGGQQVEGTGCLQRPDGSVEMSWDMVKLSESSGHFTILLHLSRNPREAGPGVDRGRYRDVFEHAVEGQYRSSIEGSYLEVNSALARLYGYDSPEGLIEGLRDLNTQLYVTPGRRAEFMRQMDEKGVVADFESEVKRADGSSIWITEFGRIVRSEEGASLYFEGSVIETTERKRVEAALKQSEEKYRHLAEMTSVVPWEAHLETGEFDYVGPQAVDFLGYPVSTWLESGFWKRVVHEEDQGWVSIVRGEAIEKRQRCECEYRLRRADGQIVWTREISSVLPGADGHLVLGGFLLDVTYRRESEVLLRESQDFIEQIAAASPMIAYLYDPQRQQSIYVNGRVPDILGYPKETLSEMRPLFLISLAHPDEVTGHVEYFASWPNVSSQKIFEREFRLRHATGGWIWLRSRECIFKGSSPAGTLRVIGTIEDISLQRDTLDELIGNERIFRRLVETTGAVPFDFDLETQRFTYVGPQAERIFGHPLRRWYSADFWNSFVHQPDVDQRRHLTADPYARWVEEFQTEFRVHTADGRLVWVRQIIHLTVDEDFRKRVRGFLFDVNEAKELEEERERSRVRLRELAARGQEIREEERKTIAREIHDELGQALTLYNIDIAWLRSRIGKLADVEIRPALENKLRSMEDAVQSTLQVVRRILCALRPPLLDELGLKEAIEWQMQDFARRVGVRYELDATPIVSLPGSSMTAVFRIFQEILTNAARHAKASRIKVSLREGPEEFVMRVEDNGVGIPESKLLHTKTFGILGMRERAWSVGGEVKITSSPGRGTEVMLRIPALPAPGAAATDQ